MPGEFSVVFEESLHTLAARLQNSTLEMGWEMVILDTGVSGCFHEVLPTLASLILPVKGAAPLFPLSRHQLWVRRMTKDK